MGLKVTNNAFGTLNAGINSSATTIVLTAGQGARFPTLSAGDYFYATLIDTSNNLEIVKVTARSTDTMTVVRGQDNTTARAYSTNDRFELRPTAALFNEKANDADVSATYLPKAGGTMTGALLINAEGTKISANSNQLIIHDTSEADTGANWWYMYRTSGDGALRFYRNGDKVTINSAGIVTAPNTPAFHVSQSTGPSGFAANSIATWNVVTTNIGGYFKTTSGTGQNQRFIAPVSGLYHFNCLMLSNSNTQLFFALRKNTGAIPGTNTETYSGSAFQSVTSTATVYLAANDFVDVFVGTNAAYGSSYANFNGFLIG
jgi:hypothetical protein